MFDRVGWWVVLDVTLIPTHWLKECIISVLDKMMQNTAKARLVLLNWSARKKMLQFPQQESYPYTPVGRGGITVAVRGASAVYVDVLLEASIPL